MKNEKTIPRSKSIFFKQGNAEEINLLKQKPTYTETYNKNMAVTHDKETLSEFIKHPETVINGISRSNYEDGSFDVVIKIRLPKTIF